MDFGSLIGYLDFALGAGLAAVIFLGRQLWKFAAPAIYREFGLKRPGNNVICISRAEKVRISTNYIANIETYWTCLLLRQYKKGDIVQYYSKTEQFSENDIKIRFYGLKIESYFRTSKNNIANYMEPIKNVRPLEIFKWKTVLNTDPVYGPDPFYSIFDIDRETGILTISLQSELEISEIFIRKFPQLPLLQSLLSYNLDEKVLFELFLRGNRRANDAPSTSRDDDTYQWTIRNPRRWSRYIVFGLYKHSGEKSVDWEKSRRLGFREMASVFILKLFG